MRLIKDTPAKYAYCGDVYTSNYLEYIKYHRSQISVQKSKGTTKISSRLHQLIPLLIFLANIINLTTNISPDYLRYLLQNLLILIRTEGTVIQP